MSWNFTAGVLKCRFLTHLPNISKPLTPFFLSLFGKKKQDKIKRKVMSLDYSDGGLRAPNIELMSKSLKPAWIARLLKKEQAWEESWKTIPNYFLNKYGGLNFLLKCNYNEKLVKQTNLPQCYNIF